MKFKSPFFLLLILLFINYATKAQDSTVVDSLVPNSLVAHYSFTGNAIDSSDFGNDGQVFGATLTEDRFGNANSAYEFDGFDDYLFFDGSDALGIEGDLTLSVWLNSNTFVGVSRGIISYYGSNNDNSTTTNGLYRLTFSNTNSIKYFHEDSSSSDVIHEFTDYEFNSNSWYYVTVTRKIASKELQLFVNGDLVETYFFESNPFGGELSQLFVGQNNGTVHPERFFQGKLDDIRIFNYVISDSVIQDLYTEGGWPLPDTVIVPNDTLSAYYPFNGDASDSSGYGNHAEVFGSELTTDRFGEFGFAYEFDGVDDYIEIQNPVSFHSNKNLSFSFWAKGVSPDSSFRGLVTKRNMNPFGIAIDDGDRLLFTVNNDEIPLNLIIESLYTDPSEWYQYVAVFKAGEYLRLFRDGIEIGTLYGTIPSNMNVDSGSINFGVTVISTSSRTDSLFFQGGMDEIRFYNYDLTPVQVLNLYNQEITPLVSVEGDIVIPNEYSLYQNYPNPFNPSTIIKFDLPETSKVSLRVYDITGRLIATLIDDLRNAGSHQVNFDASELASGIYLYELRTNGYSNIKKFTLIK